MMVTSKGWGIYKIKSIWSAMLANFMMIVNTEKEMKLLSSKQRRGR